MPKAILLLVFYAYSSQEVQQLYLQNDLSNWNHHHFDF